MSKTKAEKPKPYNVFACLTCSPHVELTPEQVPAHLKEVHSVNESKGKRTMQMHIDGDTWFSSEYDWDIGGIKLHQSTRNLRRGMDAAMWSGE